ncbi:MAG: hypothetical protein WBR15_01860 [Gammaproteobacteria bacterium]
MKNILLLLATLSITTHLGTVLAQTGTDKGGVTDTRFINQQTTALIETVHVTWVLAAGTLALAVFSFWQILETCRNARRELRAYVRAVGITPLWEHSADHRTYNWRFRPKWENSGSTPTKNLRLHVNFALRDTELPTDFDFNYETHAVGTGLIAPKITLHGGVTPVPSLAPITTQDIVDMQAGRKYFYIYGWAKYFDVFSDTDEHITRFCWIITPVGNAAAFMPGFPDMAEPLTFPYLYYAKGNCADEECNL